MGLAPMVVDEIFDFLAACWPREGSSLLLVEQYVDPGPRARRLRLPAQEGTIGFGGEPAELDGEDVFSEYLGQSAAEPAVKGRS